MKLYCICFSMCGKSMSPAVSSDTSRESSISRSPVWPINWTGWRPRLQEGRRKSSRSADPTSEPTRLPRSSARRAFQTFGCLKAG